MVKAEVAVILTCLFISSSLIGAEPNLQLDLGGKVGINLVLVPAGDFTQGSPAEEAGRGTDEAPRHVTISREFYLSRSAVTRGQWERFAAETGYRSEAETGTSGGYGWDGTALAQKKQFTWRNPGFPQTEEHPVCLVTFPDAQAFCDWLGKRTHRKVTLPTEAQWEYACRAGTTTPWHSGASADEAIWHKGNSNNATHPVDSKPANAWGLFMGGNVSEWCLDWYAPYQATPVTDPLQGNPNLSDKPRRVLRGGSWLRDAKNTRSAARYRADPRSRNADIGFRVVCLAESIAIPPAEQQQQTAVPNVEVEPGGEPAIPVQLSHDDMPANPISRDHGVGSIVGSLFGGILCFLIPIGLVVLLVRFFSRQAQKPSDNPFVVQTSPQRPPPQQSAVRMVDDGFWVHGDWPVGKQLSVSYVTGGVASMMDLCYQPGPQGQFVYTGVTPESASVVAAGENASPDSVFMQPSPVRSFMDTPPPSNPRPPIFPSAY